MRVLVTGGAGFLGKALCNALVAQGHSVLAFDDLSTGDPLYLDSRVLFHRGDVRDRPRLWSLLQGVDVVYHLAARVLVAESVLYPADYNAVNVGGTLTLLEAMRDVMTPRLIFTSSGAVYGDQQVQPIAETARPKPQSPYAVSKLAAEYYIHTIGALWGIDTVVFRVFNAYGPHQMLLPTNSPVVTRFLRQALGGGSIVIFGDGTQTRDFVYVDDVVSALIAAASSPSVSRETINLGSGVPTTVRTLAELVLEVTGTSTNIIYSPAQSGGVARLCADTTKARALLGYSPKVTLAEGLRRMLDEDPRFRRLA